jgi:hypothetical protein
VSGRQPLGCCAIEPSGEIAWTAPAIHAMREGPDDTLVATRDDLEQRSIARSGVATRSAIVAAGRCTPRVDPVKAILIA